MVKSTRIHTQKTARVESVSVIEALFLHKADTISAQVGAGSAESAMYLQPLKTSAIGADAADE